MKSIIYYNRWVSDDLSFSISISNYIPALLCSYISRDLAVLSRNANNKLL